MHISYSSYKNDLISFNYEEYNKNLLNSIDYNIFFNFIKSYKEIENEDFKKPIFSQTSKFKKIPNNYKNYKYVKITRDNEETKNIWVFENPTEESKKILILIKTYLNKISEDSYKKISIDFINELILIQNENLFHILSTEILNKCLFDNKYRNLYINLCYKIWNNKQIHYNLIKITNNNNLYYWENNNKINGPFTSEINAKNDAFNKINFKRYFLNYIQNLYISKDMFFENLTEEETFIKKKKILLLIELITIIYIEKYINFDIINIIIIDLFHLNQNFKDIIELEYEALYNIFKSIKNTKNDFNEYKEIFGEYINIINNILTNNNLSKRSIFFLNDVISNLNFFISKNNDTKIDKENKDLKNIIADKLNKNNFTELISIYNNIDYNEKLNLMYKIIEKLFYDKKINKNIINLLFSLNDSNIFFKIIEKMILNIKDIQLDFPDANEKLIYLINNINYDNDKKNDLLNILKNFDSESEEDSDEDSD